MPILKYNLPVDGGDFELRVHPQADPIMAASVDGTPSLFFGLGDDVDGEVPLSEDDYLTLSGVMVRSFDSQLPKSDEERDEVHWGYLKSFIDSSERDWHLFLDITDQIKKQQDMIEQQIDAREKAAARDKILRPQPAPGSIAR